MKSPLFCLLLLCPFMALSQEFSVQSSDNQTQLIELFTSEGCSSCPPADRWFTRLKQQQGLWQDFIPVAFHVDYWDYIGWKDPFASAQYSKRQRQHRIANNIGSVYTPGVLKAGQEWRYWHNQTIQPNDKKVGQLAITVSDQTLKGEFNGLSGIEYIEVNVALVAMDLQTEVRAGENRGKQLNHDFVVIKHQKYTAQDKSFNVQLGEDFFDTPHKNLAFVTWVESDLVPIQAVAKPL